MDWTLTVILVLAVVFGVVASAVLLELRRIRKELARRGDAAACKDQTSLRLQCIEHRLGEIDRLL